MRFIVLSLIFTLFACQNSQPSNDNQIEIVSFPKYEGGEIYTSPLTLERINKADKKVFTIALMNQNKFVSSEDGLKDMKCDRKQIGVYELFELKLLDGGKYSLKGSNMKYVSSNNGVKAMKCDRKSAGNWEKFTLVHQMENTFAIKGNNNRFVSSENGKNSMKCDREKPDMWEKFSLFEIVPNYSE